MLPLCFCIHAPFTPAKVCALHTFIIQILQTFISILALAKFSSQATHSISSASLCLKPFLRGLSFGSLQFQEILALFQIQNFMNGKSYRCHSITTGLCSNYFGQYMTCCLQGLLLPNAQIAIFIFYILLLNIGLAEKEQFCSFFYRELAFEFVGCSILHFINFLQQIQRLDKLLSCKRTQIIQYFLAFALSFLCQFMLQGFLITKECYLNKTKGPHKIFLCILIL